EHPLAEAVSKVPSRPQRDFVQESMRASLAIDYGALARIEVQNFLNTGTLEHLIEAINSAESDGGWRSALPLQVKLVLINPQDGRWPLRLLRSVFEANQFDLVAQFCDISDAVQIFQMSNTLFRAALAGERRAPEEGLKILDKMKKPLPK